MNVVVIREKLPRSLSYCVRFAAYGFLFYHGYVTYLLFHAGHIHASLLLSTYFLLFCYSQYFIEKHFPNRCIIIQEEVYDHAEEKHKKNLEVHAGEIK